MTATKTTKKDRMREAARLAAYREMLRAVRAWVNVEYAGVCYVADHDTDLIAVSFWSLAGAGCDVAQFHLDPNGHGSDSTVSHTAFRSPHSHDREDCVFCEGNRAAEGVAK